MRVIDIAIRVVTVVAFVGFFIFPDAIEGALLCGLLFSTGLWGVLFPPGIIAWAKTAHPALDPSDRSIWWLPRLIGSGFIAMAVFMTAVFSGKFR